MPDPGKYINIILENMPETAENKNKLPQRKEHLWVEKLPLLVQEV